MRLSEDVSLGQAQAKFVGQIRVLVQDLRDKPVPGVKVEVRNGSGKSESRITDWRGVAVIPFETSSDSVIVLAHLPEGPSGRPVTTAEALKEVITFRSVETAQEPFLTPIEAVSGAIGIVTGAIGFIQNIEWLKAVGEAFFVVTLFSKVARSR